MKTMGDVMFDVEALLDDMITKHDLQRHEILALIDHHIIVHHPGAIEEYENGTTPIYFYGPKESFYKLYGKGE